MKKLFLIINCLILYLFLLVSQLLTRIRFPGVREPIRHADGADDVGTGTANRMSDEPGILQHGVFVVHVFSALDHCVHVRRHLLQVSVDYFDLKKKSFP